MEKIAPRCVQCGNKMVYTVDWDKYVPICTEPDCPVYGLLQVGIEKMPTPKVKTKKI